MIIYNLTLNELEQHFHENIENALATPNSRFPQPVLRGKRGVVFQSHDGRLLARVDDQYRQQGQRTVFEPRTLATVVYQIGLTPVVQMPAPVAEQRVNEVASVNESSSIPPVFDPRRTFKDF